MTPNKPLRVLIVEDRSSDAELLLYQLRRAGFQVTHQRVETEPDYLAALAEGHDLILADYTLPQMNARRALRLLLEQGLDIPFIVVTGTVSEEVAVECMKLGAADYLIKDRLARLGPAIEHALHEKSLRDQKRAADEALRRHTMDLERLVNERTEELRRAKEHVEAILNYASDAIVLMHLDGSIRQCNPAFYRLFHYSVDELFGKPATHLVPEESKPLLQEVLTAVLDGGAHRRDLRIVRSNGTVLDAEIAVNLMRAGREPAGIVCTIRDVSERNRMERALAESEARYRRLADNAHDTIYRYRLLPTPVFEYISPAVTALTGYAPEEFFQHPELVYGVVSRDDAAQDEQQTDLVDTFARPQTLQLVRKDGALIWVENQSVPVYDENGQVVAIEGIVRDVTQRQRAQDELRRALEHERELNELKNRFASMVSHEFRTPLAVIQSSSDLLRHYGDRLSDERRGDHLGEIQKQVRHLTSLLDDVLMLNRVQAMGLALHRQHFSLLELTSEIMREIQQTTQRHEIILQASEAAQDVYLDPKLMRQVIGNLLHNAVKYSPEGRCIWVALETSANQAVIRIRDEGIGIPEEDLPRLFQMFHRAHNVGTISGTGIGLAIIKQAVDAHGGTISCKSAPGKGTEFTVWLPASPDNE